MPCSSAVEGHVIPRVLSSRFLVWIPPLLSAEEFLVEVTDLRRLLICHRVPWDQMAWLTSRTQRLWGSARHVGLHLRCAGAPCPPGQCAHARAQVSCAAELLRARASALASLPGECTTPLHMVLMGLLGYGNRPVPLEMRGATRTTSLRDRRPCTPCIASCHAPPLMSCPSPQA